MLKCCLMESDNMRYMTHVLIWETRWGIQTLKVTLFQGGLKKQFTIPILVWRHYSLTSFLSQTIWKKDTNPLEINRWKRLYVCIILLSPHHMTRMWEKRWFPLLDAWREMPIICAKIMAPFCSHQVCTPSSTPFRCMRFELGLGSSLFVLHFPLLLGVLFNKVYLGFHH